MADPLSIAASIAGLISLADIVFTRLIKYKKSVKDAEKELGDLAKEVNLLGGALNSLARLARALEAGSFDSNLRMHNIEDCSHSLTAMDKELRKIDLTSIRTKLFRPISSDQVREWLDLLSRHKQNINLALSADSMDAMLKLLAKEDEHVDIVKETRRITIRIDKAMEDKRLLGFYLQHNPQQNYDMSLRLRHGRTGLWLTRLPQFQRWLSNPDSRLWLKGIPGAGKTVLAASIVEAALGKCNESIACAFFFCDYKVSITQNIDTVLLAIVYQLGLQKMEAYDLLKHHYEEYHPGNGLPRQPGEEEVKAILHRILKMYDHVYLVIDGLDECGKHTTDVTSALAGISRASTNVSIALLSRDEDEVRYHLHEDFVPIEVAAHKQDIVEYVTTEIEERIRNGKLDLRDPELKAEALSRLVDGANGIWVACQLDHLAECDSAQECRDALQSLPPTLNETYIRILERIPPKKIRIVRQALHAIAFVVPPLKKRELQHLLAVPECGSNFDHRHIIGEEAITKYCSSLIRQSSDRTYFEFSHFSVQEFLEAGSFLGQQLEVFRISSSTSDCLLAIECLKYLLLGNFARLSIDEVIEAEETSQRGETYSFYLHAATSWQDYASEHWENQISMPS
ncbi:hypothetical protein K456DRAFT_1758367 [Colletotrichum gloeosporioides 23]|nr:hypothetical protein K456DRAFT_1758367 [Colletotrichum gloeosporioides 23]